jgi:putative ABC transport system permease protein
MFVLALANLTHRKVRSFLSVVAVAIAICLLLVLVGLSTGTLHEVSNRMQSVEAEIVVRDKYFDLGSMSGGKLWEKEIPLIDQLQLEGHRAVQKVLPVFLGRLKLAGLSQNVFGVYPRDFSSFAGSRRLLAGELFTDIASPEQALQNADAGSGEHAVEVLQLIIDERLSQAAKLHVGDKTSYGDTPAQIVGIVETGVAGRVFAPINALRVVNGVAAHTAHMFFVKSQGNLSNSQLQLLAEKIEQTTKRTATLVGNYGQVLADNFRNITIFVSLVSVISLVICFLFILVTIYTMVLERGKEIAILQSLGANRHTILWQTVQEAFLICSTGTVLGILLAFAARWLIETIQPLMTIEIQMFWLFIATLIGLGGGVVSSIYPGYVALRHDPVETLSFE